MIRIEAEEEHYCLVTNGANWAVIERRAGRYYPLGDCRRPGVVLGEDGAETLFTRPCAEVRARVLLHEVASEWRSLFECIR